MPKSIFVRNMCRVAAILSLLVAFNAGWAYGVDIVVKIDKYAPTTDDCDTAINNVEVILLNVAMLCTVDFRCKATYRRYMWPYN